jgi:putative acetyltransferase
MTAQTGSAGPQVEIRAYRDSDLAGVRRLVEAVLTEFGFAHTVGGIERDLQQIAARYGARAGGAGGFWVADSDGAIVGTVAVRPKDGDGDGEAGTCELKRLYLDPGWRGRGLGQALYEHAESFARAAGYRRIWLDSSRRFAKAHRLYARNGFVLLEQLDNDWEDNVYEKRLT